MTPEGAPERGRYYHTVLRELPRSPGRLGTLVDILQFLTGPLGIR